MGFNVGIGAITFGEGLIAGNKSILFFLFGQHCGSNSNLRACGKVIDPKMVFGKMLILFTKKRER